MDKFKVGDKVRIKNGLFSGYDYNGLLFTYKMDKCKGKIYKIERISSERLYTLEGILGWTFNNAMLEPVYNSEIHITTDGKTTHAMLKENGEVTKRAVAKCSPEDNFDFKTGAELAFNRLFEEKPNIPEEFWDRWKTEKIAVNCETENESKEFLVEADKRGFKWSSGNFLLNHLCWHVYEDETCYYHNCNGACYADTDFYKSHGYAIIYYSDLAQGKLPPKQEFKQYLLELTDGSNIGVIGTSTPITDIIGRTLKVGDTVELYRNTDNCGECAVCFNERYEFYIAGVANCEFQNGISGDFKIIKKRSHAEIADGEKVGCVVYHKKP